MLIGASRIAQQIGAGRFGTLCAVAFAASIPIGVLESSSTQNDLVVAFWLVCLTWIGLRIARLQTPRPAWPLAVGFGARLMWLNSVMAALRHAMIESDERDWHDAATIVSCKRAAAAAR